MNVMPAWAFETRNLVMKNLLWLWNVCRYNVKRPYTYHRRAPFHHTYSLQRAILHMHLVDPDSDPMDSTLWEW